MDELSAENRALIDKWEANLVQYWRGKPAGHHASAANATTIARFIRAFDELAAALNAARTEGPASTGDVEGLVAEVRAWMTDANIGANGAAYMERLCAALSAPTTLPQDVADLVLAARRVAFSDQSPEALQALDRASELFASRAPWDGEELEAASGTPPPDAPARHPTGDGDVAGLVGRDATEKGALARAGFDRPMDITQALMGPHEWGYRDPVEGGFVADDAPFAGAELISHLRAECARAKADAELCAAEWAKEIEHSNALRTTLAEAHIAPVAPALSAPTGDHVADVGKMIGTGDVAGLVAEVRELVETADADHADDVADGWERGERPDLWEPPEICVSASFMKRMLAALSAPTKSDELRKALEEAVEHIKGLTEWPADKAIQEHYSRTDWQAGYDCATNDAAKEAAELLPRLLSTLQAKEAGR